jgi:hypothetical protein
MCQRGAVLYPTPCNGVSEFGVSDSPCNRISRLSTMNEWGVNLQ